MDFSEIDMAQLGIGGILVLTTMVIPYLVPAIIAFARRHHHRFAIAALNILLGWTVLGWFIAFIWSLTAKRVALEKADRRNQRTCPDCAELILSDARKCKHCGCILNNVPIAVGKRNDT